MSEDPSQVDSATLFKSAIRDLHITQEHLHNAHDFLNMLVVTLNELQSRREKETIATIAGHIRKKVERYAEDRNISIDASANELIMLGFSEIYGLK